MLNEAKSKPCIVNWKLFDIIATDYEDNFFAVTICSLAIHHFQDLETAFKEVS